MKKAILLSVFLCWAFGNLLGQNVWKKRMNSAEVSLGFMRFHTDGEHYFFSSQRNFVQYDPQGTITGFVSQDATSPIWMDVRKKQDASTGHPYFWILRYNIPSQPAFTVAAYRPGVGIVNERTFADTLTEINNWNRVHIVASDDSAMVVVGQSFYRKIRYSESSGFVEEWAKPLNMPVTAALSHNGLLILSDETGVVTAFDAGGSIVWAKNLGMALRGLKTVSDGWIGCGRRLGDKAGIVKLALDGTAIWSSGTSDMDYYDIISTSDGELVVTGISENNEMCLLKFDGAGQPIWKKEYGTGRGIGVVAAADSGFIIAGLSNVVHNRGQYLIKTDALGETAPTTLLNLRGRTIKTNYVQADFLPKTSLFFDGNDGRFVSIADSGIATIFTCSPHIGGYASDNTLHLAADTYSFSDNNDFRPGTAYAERRDFNRVWTVNREEIANLRRDFAKDNTIDELVPYDMLTWPAKGNPNLKYNLDFTEVTTDPNEFLAPFVDVNNDGIYNVYDGDYPLIKGDQMAWWVMTDSLSHTFSHPPPFVMDLLFSAFAYDCPQNGIIDRAIFLDVDVTNRSDKDYQDAYMGFYTHFQLGCTKDDFVGTIPDINSYYVYNQYADDAPCKVGEKTFGTQIPVQSVTFLNRKINHANTYLMPAFQGLPPIHPNELYQVLQGKWRTGAPLTYGDLGYNPNSTDIANHIFPGNPANPEDWSLCTVDSPALKNILFASHGPFDFAKSNTFNVRMAFLLHPDIPHPCPDIFGLVKPNIEQLQQWHDDGSLSASVDLGQVVKLPPGQNITLDASVLGATYSWSTGASTPTITVNQPGEYAVTVTLTTGCQITDQVLVDLSALQLLPAQAPAWNIRPNPARDFILVDCPECLSADDTSWRTVLRNAQGTPVLATQGLRVQARDLSPGFYWLELWHDARFLGSRKVVVAR